MTTWAETLELLEQVKREHPEWEQDDCPDWMKANLVVLTPEQVERHRAAMDEARKRRNAKR